MYGPVKITRSSKISVTRQMHMARTSHRETIGAYSSNILLKDTNWRAYIILNNIRDKN